MMYTVPLVILLRTMRLSLHAKLRNLRRVQLRYSVEMSKSSTSSARSAGQEASFQNVLEDNLSSE